MALDLDRDLLHARGRDGVGERRFSWCRVLVQDPAEVVSDTHGWAHIVVRPVDLPEVSSLVRPGKSPESFSGLCSRARGSGLRPQAGVGEHTTA